MYISRAFADFGPYVFYCDNIVAWKNLKTWTHGVTPYDGRCISSVVFWGGRTRILGFDFSSYFMLRDYRDEKVACVLVCMCLGFALPSSNV